MRMEGKPMDTGTESRPREEKTQHFPFGSELKGTQSEQLL